RLSGRRRLRRVDGRHAVARHEFLRAADSSERRDLPLRAHLRADLVHAVRRAAFVTAAPGRAIVVVPTFNERDNLPIVIAALMAQPNVSVLVVDDRSPDGTGAIADELAR